MLLNRNSYMVIFLFRLGSPAYSNFQCIWCRISLHGILFPEYQIAALSYYKMQLAVPESPSKERKHCAFRCCQPLRGMYITVRSVSAVILWKKRLKHQSASGLATCVPAHITVASSPFTANLVETCVPASVCSALLRSSVISAHDSG